MADYHPNDGMSGTGRYLLCGVCFRYVAPSAGKHTPLW